MAKPYETLGIPENIFLGYDDPPSFAVIYRDDEESLGEKGLLPYEVRLWGQAEYWTALEAALLVCEMNPNDVDLYAVRQETIADEGFGTKHSSWKHEFQFEIGLDALFLFERSSLAPKAAPVEWIKYYRQISISDPHFGGTRFGEKWFSYFANHLEESSLAGDSQTIDHAHVSGNLAKLNLAATKFWANADRDDRSTHPSNTDVVNWLVEHGFSKKTAEAGATIIRPEWAPSGRKPEE